MTNAKIALQVLLRNTSDASMLRGMISFAAERLMALQTEPLCGAAPGERSAERINQRNGYRDRDWRARGHRRAARSEATPRCLLSGDPEKRPRRDDVMELQRWPVPHMKGPTQRVDRGLMRLVHVRSCTHAGRDRHELHVKSTGAQGLRPNPGIIAWALSAEIQLTWAEKPT